MKSSRFIINSLSAFVVIAALMTGCTNEKDNGHLFRIHAEQMESGSSKVLVNPTNLSSSWVEGEYIGLNEENCEITKNGNEYSITCGEVPSTPIYAFYPISMNALGNDIVVTGTSGSRTMTLRRIAVDFSDDLLTHKVLFPMAAYSETNNGTLHFDHLTGGLRLTIENSALVPCTLSSVRIITNGANEAAVAPVSHKGVTISWENQGLVVPGGQTGGVSGDITVSYASEMRVMMRTSGNEGVVIPARVGSTNGRIVFCVPATVRSMTGISVTAYNSAGGEVFTLSKTIEASIARNGLYDIPAIEIEN